MKLQRFIRDMPKHERHSSQFLEKVEKDFQSAEKQLDSEEGFSDEESRNDRLEDLFTQNGYSALREALDYEPVMYKLVNELESKRNKQEESLVEL